MIFHDSSPPLALTLLHSTSRKAFVSEYASSPETAIPALIRRIRRLSPPQQATLKALCQHLARVVEYEPVNKMTASNLGMVFSTVVFGEEEGTTLETLQHFKVGFSRPFQSYSIADVWLFSRRIRRWSC